MNKFFSIGAVSALALAHGASAATLSNGGFDTQDPTVTGFFTTLNAGSTSLTDWSIGGSGVDVINSFWQPHMGTHSLDLSALGAGSVSQTVTGLNVGQSYTVSFYMAGNTGGGSVIKSLDASFDGTSAGTFTFDTTGFNTSNMGWSERSFSFTAAATSGVLSFTSLENNAYGAALDSVSISAAPIPLPAGGLLLLSGLGVLALRRRKG